VRNNLPEFIHYIFKGHGHPSFTWSQFVRHWWDKTEVVHIKYEQLLQNTEDELKRVIYELTEKELKENVAHNIACEYSFERMSGRKPGEEDKTNFMRKGISGDWKNYFSKEARQILDFYAGKELIYMGYENNDRWVNSE